ncbi:AMP-binding protein [Micromonospora sp. WMMD714]|uniref:AMP-binding protein n=1 Tax=Micromonospora sp. WMMD714 TaxID=3016097 RepID=UPI00249C09D3|nr:AMP-binding protein [Micromonospora sp. WMMD714]WFE64130.1 AMP-binding protein [Micromonospora sp. WMMD714]
MTGSVGGASDRGSVVDHALRAAALAMPSAEALVIDPGSAGNTLVWRDLERRTARLAQHLDEVVAARAGGPCAVEVPAGRSAAALLWLVAALRTALPVVLVDPSAPQRERTAVRRELRGAGLGLVVPVAGDGTVDERRPPGHLPALAGAPPRAAVPPHALVLASGGSTGRPKLVVDTTIRRPAVHEHLQVTSRLAWRADQTQLVTGRLHHAAPLTFFVRGLVDGNRLVVPSRYASSIAARLIEEQRVRWMQATPFQLQHLAAWLHEHPADLGSLRAVLHMSASCPPSVRRRWIDWVGAEHVFEIYGATEGLGLTVASGAEWLARPGTVGRGFYTRIRILDEAMRPVPRRAVGTVFLRSLGTPPTAVYLGGDARLATSPDGFRSVGDRGRLDEDGYLYLEPRRVDMINVAGENVYPAEVEAVLVGCPGIMDAAVTGVADDRLGARPVAVVTCWPGVTLDERAVLAYCRERLSAFKTPRWIRVVDRIPVTPAGKVDRRGVADLVSGFG